MPLGVKLSLLTVPCVPPCRDKPRDLISIQQEDVPATEVSDVLRDYDNTVVKLNHEKRTQDKQWPGSCDVM